MSVSMEVLRSVQDMSNQLSRRLDAVTAERDALLAVLRRNEFSATVEGVPHCCPECGLATRHSERCELAAALAARGEGAS